MSDQSWHHLSQEKVVSYVLLFAICAWMLCFPNLCSYAPRCLGSGHRSPGRIRFPIRGGLAGAYRSYLKNKDKNMRTVEAVGDGM